MRSLNSLSAATRSHLRPVPWYNGRIKDEAEPLGVGQLKQGGNFSGVFNIAGAVMMKDGTKAGFFKNSFRNLIRRRSQMSSTPPA